MPSVGVVTDSTACIPPDVAKRHGITVIPLDLAFGDTVYRDGLEEGSAAFYEALRMAKEPPTTAAPAPGVYADAILQAGEGRDAVVCLTVSRQFSAMYEAAVQGAQLAGDRAPSLDIRVVDSGAAAMAQGFVVLEAARAAERGDPLAAVLDRAERLMPRVQLLVALDTLTYLARSGRVPRLLVWAASPLRVKPLVEFRRGAYRPIGVVRTKRGAVERLLRALERRAEEGALHVAVHHTDAREEGEALAERVAASLDPKEILVSEFTHVMGVHTGPGLLGFGFYTEP